MTVGDLLDRMSSMELTEWAALYRIEAEEAAHNRKVSSSRQSRAARRR